MMARRFAVLGVLLVATALLLSLLWRVPYVYTVTGFATWAFAGHLITIDDDMPGGFSIPDGVLPFPWLELLFKGLVLLVLVCLIAWVPAARSWGAV